MEYEELACAYGDALLRFARVLTGDRGLAEDLVQDVFVELYRRRAKLSEVSALDAYARRMLVNAYVSWGRKWFRVRLVAEPPERNQAGPAENHAAREDLRWRLSRLPRRQRAVLVLRYYCDLSDTEIATYLGCSVSTVRSHASRALASLRVDMAAEDQSEGERR